MLRHSLFLVALGQLVVAGPARAVPADEIDQQLAASATADTALALARQQAGAGQLLEALASSERALFLDPRQKPALLLHATLLCRLDDGKGAAAEFSLIHQADFRKDEWQAAIAQCPGVLAPAGR